MSEATYETKPRMAKSKSTDDSDLGLIAAILHDKQELQETTEHLAALIDTLAERHGVKIAVEEEA